MTTLISKKMHFCKDLLLRKFPSEDYQKHWAGIE